MALPTIVTVQTALDQFRKQTAGVRCITVTDRDGVVVLRAPESDDNTSSGVLTTIFSLLNVQSEKVKSLGSMNTVLSTFKEAYLLQIGMEVLVISIIADRDANIGAIMALTPSLKELLQPTQHAVKRETELTRG
ncbi:unnamed protein product [Effrenium voratum]|uniref:Roadblock/LAMTOR2 domain-containing protein n=1 Tax=Effrenium voratum TaxID=2562239 RepID=A0AA36HZL3_9DINO|nr:unnamed protein product [Effrenium voratum]|mmetsp:Transcript_122840/g.292209  ORF Transcript_122840/g.292209 Transcript_122840/m.292209 type:complete len:134 (+) Transcript_122840:45-446(+)|eukprot:CAMPEP_0181453676 /NCGR_PEP_ID=MMETSP1110-20121109/29847_1 /TAXON_ID=174948 /ORGANISM="Symbiodinium sp., Strain CCMP421" /LENGTH=133 /DNA_ID=CAMNT_0023578001 /DNA_START=44 /DNA_END=445 /DNA_ORIENTATION=-